MNQKRKIYFFLPKFGGGGAEKVVYNIVKNLDRSKFDVLLLVFEDNRMNHESITEGIEYLCLNAKNKGLMRRMRFVKLARFIRKDPPDILFTSMIKINIWVILFSFFFPKKVKVISRETNVLSVRKVNVFYKTLYKLFYNHATQIIAQSNDMKNDLVANFGVDPVKITTINNPVDISSIKKGIEDMVHTDLPKNKINLIAAGSLTRKKGFHNFIDTLSQLENKENYHFTILGSGSKKKRLMKQVEALGLNKSITFMGHVENPYAYFKQADIFISSSKVEGFPNAVVEAMACGLPVIANDYLGGINEIVLKNINGKIIDIKCPLQLHGAIKNVEKMDKVIVANTIQDRYRNEIILEKYNSFFHEIATAV